MALAQVPEVSPNGHVSIWYPVPLSNGSLLSLNAIDTLVMSYDTQWQAANASMWCLTTQTQNADTDLYTGQSLGSDLESTGNYIIHDLNSQIGGTEFPLPCHFAFVDPSNETDTYAGGSFIMVSTTGIASTWSLKDHAATQVSGSLTSTSIGVIATSLSTSAGTMPYTAQSSASSTSSSPEPASSAPNSSSKPSSKSLSSGAIAGIVLGVVFGIAGIAALVWWIMRKRRQARKSNNAAVSKLESPFESSAPEVTNEVHGRYWSQASELGSDVTKEHVAESETKPSQKIGPHEMAAPEAPTVVLDTQVREVANSDRWASEQSDDTPGRQHR
ncbi:hypothetical protein LTR84_011824 [Exophiala bonariae]|uniref:Peptidase A1 domain-containing protein n=1 Tax=Exophiala bonariae TaxID=1690606 RepID=A0AAV9NH94_9EURO|nr:hypothetical protein LTR84_011824 [Exophiala bonariae]